jgi:signal transduction histidine kinase
MTTRSPSDNEPGDSGALGTSGLPVLLEKLMRLAVEHAGARRGLLILDRSDGAVVEAAATIERGCAAVSLRGEPVGPADLPLSVLNSVLSGRETVVLDDASNANAASDEYLEAHHTGSLLCLPILQDGRALGALYLENDPTTSAFPRDRIAVLDVLASQAAIWVENTRLYADLRRSEAWLEEAQHLSATGSFYFRTDRDVIEFSAQTYRMYEFDPKIAVTMTAVLDRIHPEDRAMMADIVGQAYAQAQDFDCDYRVLTPNGTVKYFHVLAHGSPLGNGALAYIGSIQDETQRHLSEQALGRVRSELAQLSRVSSLAILTASIAHELNQPLAGIVTNASTCARMLAAEPPNIEGAQETARRMIRDGHRAADVILRLRTLFARRDATFETVDLEQAATEVLALLENEMERNHVVLRTEFMSTSPTVWGDRLQLQQVILNLLRNGTEAMAYVHDRPRQLRIRVEIDDSDRVLTSVQDTGVGLDPNTLEHLFEAFYTTKMGGMGIGLTVSRSVVEAHGGRLWASPNDGPGATFSFSIPRGTDQAPDTHGASSDRSDFVAKAVRPAPDS